MLKKTEKAYAAGLIDGEGSISASHDRIHHHCALWVTVTNTDFKMLAWLQERWGGRIDIRKREPRCKQTWKWLVGSKVAEKFLRDIFPYLTTKRDRAELAFILRSLVGKRGRLDPERYQAQQIVRSALCNLNRCGV